MMAIKILLGSKLSPRAISCMRKCRKTFGSNSIVSLAGAQCDGLKAMKGKPN